MPRNGELNTPDREHPRAEDARRRLAWLWDVAQAYPDGLLSARAFGILTYAVTAPTDPQALDPDRLAEVFSEGRDVIAEAHADLVALGLIEQAEGDTYRAAIR